MFIMYRRLGIIISSLFRHSVVHRKLYKMKVQRLLSISSSASAASSSAAATVASQNSSTIAKNKMNKRIKLTKNLTESSASSASYEDAIKTLNKLQSNASTIKKSILNVNNPKHNNLKEIEIYLERSGLSFTDLDQLSVIHVSGTKGKGSTCALTESILRSFGIRTGFYSSPHLISVTERFRLNGQPISEMNFATIFWKIYSLLHEKREHDLDMPAYFQFLTILCFHIFLMEKVDVAIIEVGIGGENDCTNIVRNTQTVGITSLGLEHTNLLGNSFEEIAWQKAGIIKENSNVFTIKQREECMKVLKERAAEKNAKLYIVPDFHEYNWKRLPQLQIDNKIHNLNASLAIQLSYDWLQKNKFLKSNELLKKQTETGLPLEISENINDGLEQCFWPGRCQLVEYNNLKIYLDGAHTIESIDVCIDWFQKQTAKSSNLKYLIFNTTGDRDSTKLLNILNAEMKFSYGCFVPNIPCIDNKFKNIHDITTVYSNTEQIKRAESHSNYWIKTLLNNGNHYHSIVEALNFICCQNDEKHAADILVTGSLHLIGATILAIGEHAKQTTK